MGKRQGRVRCDGTIWNEIGWDGSDGLGMGCQDKER